ncbi:MAG: hydroxyacylglutathione hydrolase [Methylomonas sp.]|nr:hydroxyacylglutathione hydrolase [Methylomonas sp.]PPD22102.1 MAG: hydroxyacylglutathione hydrolase [Methylomonas sp.]PPD25490.1 MAG: hydroxyacylglutathione hydrolase [Methylomonas sp.]PPD36286.1 MAG: hydroxyacylglutathione hydrolase [Methylomonas sp.]PPD42411.1 MAG: hydroxyacylglutathione hydrolase [Methylomonas sp.]
MLDISLIPVLRDNYIYLLHDTDSGETAVVDPTDADPVIDALTSRQWPLHYIFNTHHHGDHVGGNLGLKRRYGCTIIGATADRDRIPGIDVMVGEGDTVLLGRHGFDIIETPGHTSGHIVFHCADSRALFCGDTLFSLGCGRLFEGSAGQLWHSLQKLKALPPDTNIYCAHEYTAINARFAGLLDPDNHHLQARIEQVANLRAQNRPTLPVSLATELATNPFLREHDANIRRHIGGETVSAIEAFALIRHLKDQFH